MLYVPGLFLLFDIFIINKYLMIMRYVVEYNAGILTIS